jgi:hypothetical protein
MEPKSMDGSESEGRRVTFILTEDTGTPGAPIWCVRSPDLKGVNTQGATVAGALEMAADAVRALGADGKAGAEVPK